jgi:hypothetical protein
MSIPGINIMACKGIRPCQREGVGGNIKSVTQGSVLFAPSMSIMAIDGDEDMFFRSQVMSGVNWSISGITKDSSGSVLGSCVVELFYTQTDFPLSKVTSDATTGAYSFNCSPNAGNYYAVAYKAGSPDVAGTTVNTLAPVAV